MCASAIGIDLTEAPCRLHEAAVLANVLLRLRKEGELRAVSESKKTALRYKNDCYCS